MLKYDVTVESTVRQVVTVRVDEHTMRDRETDQVVFDADGTEEAAIERAKAVIAKRTKTAATDWSSTSVTRTPDAAPAQPETTTDAAGEGDA